MLLEVKNLSTSIEGKEILKGVNLKIKKGEVHAIMGPNGSGKTTLAKIIAGASQGYKIKGKISFLGKDLFKMKVEERAKKGIFLAFQNPIEIPGVSISTLLRTSLNEICIAQKKPILEPDNFSKEIEKAAKVLGLKKDFFSRGINEGFSGGEKKKNEILQIIVLKPKLAILDEIDSGLDIDSLKKVAKALGLVKNKDMTLLIITHYQRILNYIKPNFVHIMSNGKIVRSGDFKLALKIEKMGYEHFC
jgi:Fe-S cluster assembly ATP-binding protein